ncbi:MAG: tyrosine-type recombinase/integrase [Candidatus Omnitrophica bacterium]|nr:tyrosine-type recombinase/integrase [Candidatus Omnitrophota bacterium]
MLKNAPTAPNLALLSHDLVKYWLKNINSAASRSSKQTDLIQFFSYTKVKSIDDFKNIKRSDIIDWRDYLIGDKKNPRYAPRTVKRRISTISKFFEYLCDQKLVETNVVLGVQRPKLTTSEGATSIISDRQAKDLLDAPDPTTIKGKRDRAILATFLYHALRRSELCKLQVKDIQEREGIKHFKIYGKGSKERYVPVHPTALTRIADYLETAGHKNEKEFALFRPLSRNIPYPSKGLSPIAVYDLVKHYGMRVGIDVSNISPHSLRATAATNTLLNGEDLRKVQQWLGHANIQTTAMYDKRDNRPEDSPTYRVRY